MKPIPIFIGYDPREAVAYHTCANSIIRQASQPVAIIPLALNLFEDYTETHTDGSNQFIYSRFLVPHLMNYTGHAIFIDGDMIVRGDIVELWNLRDPSQDVQVVKHNYKTKIKEKYPAALFKSTIATVLESSLLRSIAPVPPTDTIDPILI